MGGDVAGADQMVLREQMIDEVGGYVIAIWDLQSARTGVEGSNATAQPVMFEEDFSQVPAAGWLVEGDLRGGFGVEVAGTESGFAGAGFDEALAVPVKGGGFTLAGNGVGML